MNGKRKLLSLIACIALAVVVAAWGAKQEEVSTGSTGSAKVAATTKVEKPAPGNPTSAAKEGERPVDFTYLGITSDKRNISYKIKVNTEKPIRQVDLAVKQMDDSGKVLLDTTLAWQNIVKMTRQPIEKGKTYDVQDYLYPGATKAECKLKRVVFADGSTWSPK